MCSRSGPLQRAYSKMQPFHPPNEAEAQMSRDNEEDDDGLSSETHEITTSVKPDEPKRPLPVFRIKSSVLLFRADSTRPVTLWIDWTSQCSRLRTDSAREETRKGRRTHGRDGRGAAIPRVVQRTHVARLSLHLPPYTSTKTEIPHTE
ncbi:uncharacterized [Tachysurus ichikawai]